MMHGLICPYKELQSLFLIHYYLLFYIIIIIHYFVKNASNFKQIRSVYRFNKCAITFTQWLEMLIIFIYTQ